MAALLEAAVMSARIAAFRIDVEHDIYLRQTAQTSNGFSVEIYHQNSISEFFRLFLHYPNENCSIFISLLRKLTD